MYITKFSMYNKSTAVIKETIKKHGKIF